MCDCFNRAVWSGTKTTMAFATTPQTINQVVDTLCATYQVYPGIARKALRETGYQLTTTCGKAKFNRDQMSTIWGDTDRWFQSWKK